MLKLSVNHADTAVNAILDLFRGIAFSVKGIKKSQSALRSEKKRPNHERSDHAFFEHNRYPK